MGIEYEQGERVFNEARQYEERARTAEDLACVEEMYWQAFRVLKTSPDWRHREMAAKSLAAIAVFLDREGRRQAAKELRIQAAAFGIGRGGSATEPDGSIA